MTAAAGTNAQEWTMASLAQRAARTHGTAVAARYKSDGAWTDVTYEQLWERVRELALGFIALGIESGDRVCLLANTRLEWELTHLAVAAAGATTVPIYPTNSPDECWWVASNSGAVAVVCENIGQASKIAEVRGRLPELRHVVLVDGAAAGLETLDSIVERGRGADEKELQRRTEIVAPEDSCVIVYTSGTTGRPKGVVLTNSNFTAGGRIFEELRLIAPGDTSYLYLPLAHVFAQIIQFGALVMGMTTVYFGGDTKQIVPEIAEIRPTVLPSVPRIFEKIYTSAVGRVPPGQQEDFRRAVELGYRVRVARQRGETVSDSEQQALEQADGQLFAPIRGLFGGRLRLGIVGAAPIAPDILKFFYAVGAPVFEGWGMTETTSLGTVNTPENFKFGTSASPSRASRYISPATVRSWYAGPSS